MYRYVPVPTRPRLAAVPVDMPIDVLIAISHLTPAYNPFLIFRDLLGHFGWDRALKVVAPRLWAPAWSPEQLALLPAQAEVPPAHLPRMLAEAFPGESPWPQQYEVVHYIGRIGTGPGGEAEPVLRLPRPDRTVGPAELRDRLLAVSTRLLILEVSRRSRREAVRLAEQIALAGGPAALVIVRLEATPLHDYVREVYAGILHNRPLPEVAAAAEGMGPDLDVTFVMGEGGESMLRFDSLLDRLTVRASELASRAGDKVADLLGTRRYLHMRQVDRVRTRLDEFDRLSERVEGVRVESGEAIDYVRAHAWEHESEGVVPLAAAKEAVEAMETDVDRLTAMYEDLAAELEAEAAHAPRVLNANFADPEAGQAVAPDRSLVAGRAYHLLVDVGPRWDKLSSIVAGSGGFPEQALPPDRDGYVIRVVVISSDFTPHTASAEMWVPRHTGRSRPYIQGKPAGRSGPVALRLVTPELPRRGATPGEPFVARARLSLYHENNLLQSAVVCANVTRDAPVELATPNAVEVDYALTATFDAADEKFGRRRVRFPWEKEEAAHDVAVNLTLNRAGAGEHRIIVSGDPEHTPAWVPFSPLAAEDTLERVRGELLNCFWRRDNSGNPVYAAGRPVPGLDENHGKPRRQFGYDLWVLARQGWRLYSMILQHLQPEDARRSGVDWRDDLRRRLERAGVIQIARTRPANFAFPWTLVYEHPITRADAITPCPVLREEWSEAGIRNAPPAPRCPVEEAGRHPAENVLCPYGFWGLKHMIEQPISVIDLRTGELRDAPTRIGILEGIDLAIGWTRDPQLDAGRMAEHHTRITGTGGLRLVPVGRNPADTATHVREILPVCSVAYFLCHGEDDDEAGEAYIGIGLRDANADHRIYPSTVTG
ncbi:MAG: hypothetical protein HY703_13515, partial [Gemmatimonadetes bacterium]|nr:hypothetical protein [Gemmatimonadota bacterium]